MGILRQVEIHMTVNIIYILPVLLVGMHLTDASCFRVPEGSTLQSSDHAHQ